MEQRNSDIMESLLDIRAAMADSCSQIDTLLSLDCPTNQLIDQLIDSQQQNQ